MAWYQLPVCFWLELYGSDANATSSENEGFWSRCCDSSKRFQKYLTGVACQAVFGSFFTYFQGKLHVPANTSEISVPLVPMLAGNYVNYLQEARKPHDFSSRCPCMATAGPGAFPWPLAAAQKKTSIKWSSKTRRGSSRGGSMWSGTQISSKMGFVALLRGNVVANDLDPVWVLNFSPIWSVFGGVLVFPFFPNHLKQVYDWRITGCFQGSLTIIIISIWWWTTSCTSWDLNIN